MKIMLGCLGFALVTSASLATPAAATPLAAPSAVQNAVTPAVETVQWRWRRGAWAPLAGAAIIGGAYAASRPWGYDNYYGDYAYATYGDYRLRPPATATAMGTPTTTTPIPPAIVPVGAPATPMNTAAAVMP